MGKSQGLPLKLPKEQEAKLPNLKNSSYKVTSPDTGSYNCIAYAARDESRYWDPSGIPVPGYYWPPNAQRGLTIEALESAFATIQFVRCADGANEANYDKVALYADASGMWTHAARQRDDGLWESKLGESFDIRHKNPYALTGREYGSVWYYMKRKK
jgi:hypothetical protein